tara:strand:- start:2093 stop:2806 length:714 start_codon:yes stop_codon:yes gene_type:complete
MSTPFWGTDGKYIIINNDIIEHMAETSMVERAAKGIASAFIDAAVKNNSNPITSVISGIVNNNNTNNNDNNCSNNNNYQIFSLKKLNEINNTEMRELLEKQFETWDTPISSCLLSNTPIPVKLTNNNNDYIYLQLINVEDKCFNIDYFRDIREIFYGPNDTSSSPMSINMIETGTYRVAFNIPGHDSIEFGPCKTIIFTNDISRVSNKNDNPNPYYFYSNMKIDKIALIKDNPPDGS